MKKRKNLNIWLAMSMFLLMIVSTATAEIIFVDADANGVNDGSSWTDAYNYLQDALADASSSPKPVEIRVAQGIYIPDSNSAVPDGTGDRNATFQLINGVSLMGGYAGFGESDSNARDIELYETILSGDLDGNDVDVNDPCDLANEPTRDENSYHVVTGSGTNVTAVLDGFAITGGNANQTYPDSHGGGMYNNFGRPTLTNCAFGKNSALSGGGMYNRSGGPTLTNCMFNRNCAAGTWPHTGGAGMYNDGEEGLCSPTLTNCAFNENFSFACGGGMYNWFLSAPTLTGCSFIGNSAIQGGGIFHPCQGNPKLGNCSFRGNSSTDGGGMWNGGGSPVLVSCIFIENSAYDDGGGMFNCNNSNPILTNCTFNGNMARRGGGMQNGGIDPTLTSCLFSGNSAGQTGGGMRNVSSDPVLQNCIFNGNSAGESGGGMYNRNQSSKRKHGPTLNNCTFVANSAPDGNALACDSIAGAFPNILKMTNCILWDDGNEIWDSGNSFITINYSDIQGGYSDTGNVNADPCFADAANYDYHLKSQAGRWEPSSASWVQDAVTSPCIDAGNPMSPIGYEPFPNGGRINMGAYSGTAEASKSYFGEPLCETIVAGDINGDCKVDFKDFRIMALHWLEEK